MSDQLKKEEDSETALFAAGADRTRQLFDFIENSPTAFHAVESVARRLEASGFVRLREDEDWEKAAAVRIFREKREGGCFYVVRNDSSIIALRLPQSEEPEGFHVVASHSDSPTFKVKEAPEMDTEGHYVRLNTEKYGGMIMSTWMDRPLSVAGRVAILKDGHVTTRLVNVEEDLLVIPNLAIHMNRKINEGMEYRAQVDTIPLMSGAVPGKGALLKKVAEAAGVEPDQILGHDLFLYVREKGRILGANQEFILSPRLDDLQCAFAGVTAFLESAPTNFVNVCAVLDNEEVGSTTRQGADSTFLADTLERLCRALGLTIDNYRQMVAGGFLLSADNAHAVHPNHPEKADPTNRPYINGGVVIKYHGSQRYTTDAYTAAVMKNLCRQANVPYQTFANHSDIVGGSTLGNISTSHVSIPSVDIGLPQLAMHSAVETAGSMDTEYAVRAMKVFFAQ